MKNTFTCLLLFASMLQLRGQNVVADFETFTLQPGSYYKDTNNTPFQTSHAVFNYQWTKGAFAYWSGGFSYTNITDSSTGNFTNLYGVKPLRGYNGSALYTVAQDQGVIRIKIPSTTVEGFYYTNTTYAFKSIKNGDSFSRKFGDTTGTGSGTTIAQGSYPDYFKVVVRGYRNGNLLTDSVQFFLADYRPANNAMDEIVADWRFVNTSSLGVVDSIKFFMRSTVFNQFGMLTPGFFGIDNFTTSTPNPAGIAQLENGFLSVHPNPFSSSIQLSLPAEGAWITVYDLSGSVLYKETSTSLNATVNLPELNSGIYFLEIATGEKKQTVKIVKQ